MKNNIKYLRNTLGLTQAGIAKQLKVNKGTFARWEKAKLPSFIALEHLKMVIESKYGQELSWDYFLSDFIAIYTACNHIK